MVDDVVALSSCLACGSGDLQVYLNLDEQPLANSYVPVGQNLDRYPLNLTFCKRCFHSQLSHSVDPDLLFRDYAYVSGTTSTLNSYFDDFVEENAPAGSGRLRILEIASNDGSLLKKFRESGHIVIGVDPAANLIGTAAANGVPTVCDYWPGQIASNLKTGFDLVVAMNVLAHVPDPLKFLEAVRENAIARDSGKLIVQTSQAHMVSEGQFDTCYHEHVSFFSVRSMRALCDRAGLVLTDVQIAPVHGDSYVWTIENTSREPESSVQAHEDRELENGVYSVSTYESFQGEAEQRAKEFVNLCEELRSSGFSVWAYGAAAKSNTFINFAGLRLDGVVDDNPLKQGLISPGGGVKIFHPEEIGRQGSKLAVVCTAWNFLPEIASRIKKIRGHGEDLILAYFPRLTVSGIDQVLSGLHQS